MQMAISTMTLYPLRSGLNLADLVGDWLGTNLLEETRAALTLGLCLSIESLLQQVAC